MALLCELAHDTFVADQAPANQADAATVTGEAGRNELKRRLARISHTKKCIGAPNQRKFFYEKDFPKIRGRPDDDRL
jgi:hypothetical protein